MFGVQEHDQTHLHWMLGAFPEPVSSSAKPSKLAPHVALASGIKHQHITLHSHLQKSAKNSIDHMDQFKGIDHHRTIQLAIVSGLLLTYIYIGAHDDCPTFDFPWPSDPLIFSTETHGLLIFYFNRRVTSMFNRTWKLDFGRMTGRNMAVI